MKNKRDIAKLAFRFVLIIGIVNLFADMTYEGGRSVIGPFLGSLGASAAIVATVAGFGELMGYGLRLFTGNLADRSRRYWTFAIAGYALNMLAVPALALTGLWPAAAVLVVLERAGRAVRRPAVESMLSHAGTQLGQGWVFGLAEALDQGGATIGPLIVALVLHVNGGYHRAFAVLLAPALLCLGSIVTARVLFPRPEEFEKESGARSQESEEKVRDRPLPLASTPFSKAFWLYCIAGALVAAGFADFALIAFHFQKTGTVSQGTIPVLYALAMVMGALAPLLMGRLLDKLGPRVLMVALVLPSLFAPFAFAAGASMAIIGVLLWGIGLGIQDSQLKAALVRVIAREKRSTAFGLFDSIFGVGWFLGSAAMGLLYGHSVHAVVVFSVGLQLAALPVLYVAQRRT